MSVLEVLAVDPGVKTGIVRGLVPERGVIEPLEWWELDQQDTCDMLVGWCWKQRVRGARPSAALVIERFIPRGGAVKFEPASLEITGVARWASRRAGVRFVTQTPSDMKAVRSIATEQFPKVGRGGQGHAKDALGHLYLFA